MSIIVVLLKTTLLSEKPITLEREKSAENIVPLEQSVDTEKVKAKDSNCEANVEKIRWFDDFFILKHRFRHQCIEYLVKQRNDPDALGIWKKGIEIANHPRVIEYMSNLPKPNTRSRKQVSKIDNIEENNDASDFLLSEGTIDIPLNTNCRIDTIDNKNDVSRISKVYTTCQSKFCCPKPCSPLIFLFYFTFILSISHFNCSQPALGHLYDCSHVTKVGLYSVPPESYCS